MFFWGLRSFAEPGVGYFLKVHSKVAQRGQRFPTWGNLEFLGGNELGAVCLRNHVQYTLYTHSYNVEYIGLKPSSHIRLSENLVSASALLVKFSSLILIALLYFDQNKKQGHLKPPIQATFI